MTLVGRIEEAIHQKGLTFKSLERECGLGNGTIKRWEYQSPRLNILVKVAEYLQLSLDELVFGKKEAETFSNDGQLSQADAALVGMFHSLDDNNRDIAFSIIRVMCEKATGERKPTYAEIQAGTPIPQRIPFAASGWADITPEQDELIQEKLRQFEKRARELEGR